MAAVREEDLVRLPYWNELSEAERELVRRGSELRRCQKGDYLMGDPTECLGMILLLSGELRAFFLSEEGREITLFFLGAGETCVLSASCVIDQLTFETHLQAQSDAEILIVGAPVFRRLTQENLHVRCFSFERATDSFSDVVWTFQEILFRRVDQRLARFLLDESARLGSGELRMTQEQVALRTNTAREVAARMFKRFSAEGLVSLRRGAIRIEDEAGLRALL